MSQPTNPLEQYFARERELKRILELAQPASARLASLGLTAQPLSRYLEHIAVGHERLEAYRELSRRAEALTKPLTTMAANSQLSRAMESLRSSKLHPDLGSTFGSQLKMSHSIISQVEDLSRIGRIVGGLGESNAGQLSALIGGRHSTISEIGRMIDQLTGFQKMVDPILLDRVATQQAFVSNSLSNATALKLSTFAGSLASLGPDSQLTGAAFKSLIGEWHTRSDLPARFWKDSDYRRDMYREAEVDPWLIEADQGETIEVLVASGAVEGRNQKGRISAVIEVGDVRLEITASHARSRLQRAIDHFELELRAFIARKMEQALSERGEDAAKWFVRRVSGPIVKKAKETRQAALKAGEARAPLIHFTDLGDLLQILVRSDNWDQVFGPVLGDQGMLRSDLERLIASRRPAMHARPIDPTRLAESVLVIQRLLAGLRDGDRTALDWDEDI